MSHKYSLGKRRTRAIQTALLNPSPLRAPNRNPCSVSRSSRVHAPLGGLTADAFEARSLCPSRGANDEGVTGNSVLPDRDRAAIKKKSLLVTALT